MFTHSVLPVCGSSAWSEAKSNEISIVLMMTSGYQPAWNFLYFKPESPVTWERQDGYPVPVVDDGFGGLRNETSSTTPLGIYAFMSCLHISAA